MTARCLQPGVEELSGESQRLEDLERARMHNRCAVPLERCGLGIDQMAWHTAPLKLRSDEQPRRPRTHHEDGRLVVCRGVVTFLRLLA